MRLIILGSGSPEAYARRASSGYLVEVGGDKILFDCGGGVFDNLLRVGLRPADITHIVFSHLHSDHMMDYARLIHAAWDEGGRRIKVYGPAPIAEITTGFFGPDGVLSHDLRARTELGPSQQVWLDRGGTLPRAWPAPEIAEFVPGDMIAGNGWQIRSCSVPHAQPYLTCIAFALSSGGKKFVYSGDSGSSQELETLADRADLLLHWCYRLDSQPAEGEMAALTPTPSQIGALAQRCSAQRLILTHFRPSMDSEQQHAEALDQVAKVYNGPVTIAEDQDCVVL
ncbi:MAG: MBL fold metallo-hydrolase [Pseudomonadota bacterium]